MRGQVVGVTDDVKAIVREKYGQAAIRVTLDQANGSCGAAARDGCGADPITSNLYDSGQAGENIRAVKPKGCCIPLSAATQNVGSRCDASGKSG